MFTQREAPDTVLEREPGALVMCEHCYTVDGIDKGRFIKVSEWEGVPTAKDVHEWNGYPMTDRCSGAIIFRSYGVPEGYSIEPVNVEAWTAAYEQIGYTLWPAFCRWAEDGVVVEDMDNVPDVATFEEQFCGWWPSFYEYALNLAEDTGLMEDTDPDSPLRTYFDWDSWVSDLAYDYAVTATDAREGGVFIYRNF
ncbi:MULTISPECIES: antirestriction protein ArdA [Corynebacterium]|jgi:hypothetical protein|uniref:antirestriction protein ArdA n=1 Tax=Corynebacterium TaxID=1716 RepID=UPI001EF1A40A|nr:MULTISPECIES: antirestriction protein ArdA [Corynebacterium]MCG7451115.1 antirestriction protein ArdA [Corynebacterium kefirresidentii]MCG7453237.1 antirestriction protein ArdA [Corynebacterium kefirresidentii]MDU4570476.1 antirestriction protein ArdA [Corynebacterium sp.]MDU6013368.1 antirestriction protein ArdA [Corynebacterium sp.]MDV2431564.1 antirestriction protein ArdA [Corynebacterium tuberculostearicum]